MTPDLFSYRKYWAKRFGIAPQLPINRVDMDALGWDSCDIIIVTGDAYVDHPSFGMAIIGRLLEAQGFRVGIIAQPDWTSADDFRKLGRPNLFFGVTGGNMDSMVNRYTSDRKIRSNDAYTPDGAADRRPDRCLTVYAQRCREAFKDVPIVLGGIEASLRRIAHYDYWSDTVRRSALLDAKGDLLVYGNGERQVVEIAHRLSAGETVNQLTDVRGTAFVRRQTPAGWTELDSTSVDSPGTHAPMPNPYDEEPSGCAKESAGEKPEAVIRLRRRRTPLDQTVIRLPAYEAVKADPVLYAHASRILHQETNPGNARALVQRHGDRDVWINPPPIPLSTKEMDAVYGLPYSRLPHKSYGSSRIPAFEMIQHSVTIMRGCFGGCTFCSITEHEGRIIQSRSENSIIYEIETIRDTSPAFTGIISDIGGPTANMYRLACKDKAIEASCRRPSCVYPGICKNLNTDHTALIQLYRRARALPGIKKILIASGLRYDLAVMSPEYVRELATHHVGGYLKIAPEHTEPGPLSKMLKPGIGTYDRFKALFDKFSKEAGKEQYLIPYFIAAHPGTSDEDMLNLALWLKRNGFRADQVQAFLPSPMATATAMYHSGKNPLHRVTRTSETVFIPKKLKQRRLHKAFLRYHDPNNWPMLRDALKRMGRADLIGNGKHHLVPAWQPEGTGQQHEGTRVARKALPFRTQHTTGLPAIRTSSPRKSRRTGR
ncbi:radical SAM family protein [Methylocaldum marinum]|uniref:Radical SAM family protein n=1 Tax=Methylocaldum marinum TaxID=1432792 RepID=A0A250KSE3_9GAMM|nr:YgiQ family radical SAM protein [Methylocaldum marinum]BBA34482.1 radical SAM family protein [Methylocaldum marinum]